MPPKQSRKWPHQLVALVGAGLVAAVALRAGLLAHPASVVVGVAGRLEEGQFPLPQLASALPTSASPVGEVDGFMSGCFLKR